MTTKTADSKGRVALGKAFANSPVIIHWISATEARVVKAKVIPGERGLALGQRGGHWNGQAGFARGRAARFR